jgi:hypothetical protein
MILYKCWYYETAFETGAEDAMRDISLDHLPDEARKGKAILESSLAERGLLLLPSKLPALNMVSRLLRGSTYASTGYSLLHAG